MNATLEERLAELDAKVNSGKANAAGLMSQLDRLAADYRRAGEAAPQRLRDLIMFLEDDAMEDQFDNMPL